MADANSTACAGAHATAAGTLADTLQYAMQEGADPKRVLSEIRGSIAKLCADSAAMDVLQSLFGGKPCDVVSIDSEEFNEATLRLDHAAGIIDSIYTLACHDQIESLGNGTLASVLDAALRILHETMALLAGDAQKGGAA